MIVRFIPYHSKYQLVPQDDFEDCYIEKDVDHLPRVGDYVRLSDDMLELWEDKVSKYDYLLTENPAHGKFSDSVREMVSVNQIVHDYEYGCIWIELKE